MINHIDTNKKSRTVNKPVLVKADDIEKIIDGTIISFTDYNDNKTRVKVFFKSDEIFGTSIIELNTETTDVTERDRREFSNIDEFEDWIFSTDFYNKPIKSKYGKVKKWSEILDEERKKEIMKNSIFD